MGPKAINVVIRIVVVLTVISPIAPWVFVSVDRKVVIDAPDFVGLVSNRLCRISLAPGFHVSCQIRNTVVNRYCNVVVYWPGRPIPFQLAGWLTGNILREFDIWLWSSPANTDIVNHLTHALNV